MSIRPIADYGLMGDTRTAALVDGTGSLDWLCLPHFDGEPVFARLVAGEDGGRFRLGPRDPGLDPVGRRYRAGSAVIETTWALDGVRLTLTEGMVAEVTGTRLPTLCLVRRLTADGGAVEAVCEFDPRFGDERRRPRLRPSPAGLVCVDSGVALSFTTEGDLRVEPGRPFTAVLTAAHRGPLTFLPAEAAWQALLEDEARWRRWCADIHYHGPYGAAVERSLLTLRLLTYSPSGAPVAATTTSLPELVGGGRNWDYRYAWPRDASIGVGAFLGVGIDEEARAFLYWLLHAGRSERPVLPPLMTIQGRPVPSERLLPWAGYRDSRPVRVGNGARGQHQLDSYGWVLDAMWDAVAAGHPLFRETWRLGMALADEVARRWPEPDAGIWEERDEPEHHVHSKLMGWLALDRALRIAATHRTPLRRVRRWQQARSALADEVRARGVDHDRGTFVRAYGRHDLDASLLILPVLEFEPPGSPLVEGTIAAVRRELSAGGPFLYRYRPGDDGLEGGEGAFLPCSFWLVQALATTGHVDEAVELLDDLLGVAGPLGLLAEEVDPATGEQLGNFPQALTHASLVQATLAVRDATARAASPAPARRRRGPTR